MTASITSHIQEVINILTGSTKYQGTEGYFCDNAVYPNILHSRTNYQVIPSGGRAFLLVIITSKNARSYATVLIAMFTK